MPDASIAARPAAFGAAGKPWATWTLSSSPKLQPHLISTMATVATEQNIVRLTYREKVPVSTMKEIILSCLQERLTGAVYEGDKCNESAKFLSDTIRSRLRGLGFQRYKFVVQVVIGERREQGIRYDTIHYHTIECNTIECCMRQYTVI